MNVETSINEGQECRKLERREEESR